MLVDKDDAYRHAVQEQLEGDELALLLCKECYPDVDERNETWRRILLWHFGELFCEQLSEETSRLD
jgi:hypothetical protein